MAYGYLNDVPRAELATAETAMLQGDMALASEKAKRVIGQFKHGSPEWIKANDILNFADKNRD
jgi:predicted Zn-dependent protease